LIKFSSFIKFLVPNPPGIKTISKNGKSSKSKSTLIEIESPLLPDLINPFSFPIVIILNKDLLFNVDDSRICTGP
jgi:hypothetical protein